MSQLVDHLVREVSNIPSPQIFGRVTAAQGMLIEVGGAHRAMSVGDRCRVRTRGRAPLRCEVVGFRQDRAIVMPFGPAEGIGLGCRVELSGAAAYAHPSRGWLGRVVNALGEPIDGKGPLPQGPQGYEIRSLPPAAHTRERVGRKIDLGVRALNAFVTCCRGQRMGIFAGSGVGKSVLMSMLARYTQCDVAVIALVGERGREVQEFIEDDLGADGLARSVVVVATSDEPPLMRRQAAQLAMAVAESFRDEGRDVLCLMDSVTRYAMALREIGLSAGEPPTTKGYPPSVFAELPKLLERAGPGQSGQGSITGLFTVLVEGDDHNEPIADAVRGILDGHIVMERRIAERGRYPAINVLRSVSRTMPQCNAPEVTALVTKARQLMATYADMEELIRLGAYRPGSNQEVDAAIAVQPDLEAFLTQAKSDCTDFETTYARLAEILGEPAPQGNEA
ncbi:MAG: flagellar protein export ATPase FliI [Alphaproteobacteria bacterium]